MLKISVDIFTRVANTYGAFFEALAKIPAEKCARDVLDETKVHEQISVFCKILNKDPATFLPKKRLLEIGSGLCIFLAVTRRDYGLESFGVEPGAEGFDSSFSLGQKVLQEYGYSVDCVKGASGESLPWPDNYFDLVYSTNVLEHVVNPELVIKEAIRVLKPGRLCPVCLSQL